MISFFRNMKIRGKLVTITVFLVLFPLIGVSLLSLNRFGDALRRASEQDLEHLVRNICTMCKIQQKMLEKSILAKLGEADEILSRQRMAPGIFSEKKHSDGSAERIDTVLPLEAPYGEAEGNKPVTGRNRLVDEISGFIDGSVAILQRTKDDFLRVTATSFYGKDGARGSGQLFPRENPVTENLLRGKPYEGRCRMAGRWYITAFKPILNKDGEVLGALCVGEKAQQGGLSMKNEIAEIKVGKTGYVYIIDSKGTLKIHPAKQGVNIIDSEDSSGFQYIRAMIDDALTLSSQGVGTIRYPWINPELGETEPRIKITKYGYFEPWDWIITAGTYEEEIYHSLYETERFIMIMAILGVITALILTVVLSRFLTKPIVELTRVTAEMAEGGLSQRVKVVGADEIGILATTFNRMVGQIQEYTSDLENMVEARTVALKESREKYRRLSRFLNSILDSATEYAIIALDVRGNITEFNKGAEKIFGWNKKAVVHQKNINITDLPTDRNEARQKEIKNRAINKGVYEQDNMHRIRKDASTFPSHTCITAMRDPSGEVIGFVEIVRDITRRKVLERELGATKDFLNIIMESSIDGIVTTDLKGKIIYLNRGMEEMIQSKREDVFGQHISKFYLNGIDEARKIMELLRKHERIENYEMEVRRNDGKVLSILVSIFLLKNEAEEIMGTAGIFKDISELKRLDARLKAAHVRLVESSKLRALGELVAGVAHEINNPLMASQTILHVIMKNMSPDNANGERLALIRKCNDRIEKIVDHLREFSRVKKSEFSDVDIRVPIENALMMTGQQLLNHNITIVKDLPEDLPKISADIGQLEQVFLNLISNSRDAMHETDGDKVLSILASVLEEDGDPFVRVLWKDTGAGIPKEIIDKIMEPFFSTKPTGKGTGLGLSLCFGIIESHKGRLDIRSEVGKGTEVSIFIPAKQGSSQINVIFG